MESIRSFIAVELPEETRTEIGKLQSRLRTERQNWIKWVSPDSIHLTLKFLGDIDAGKTGEILEAIKDSVAGISRFRIRVRGLGVFPNLGRIQVIWVGLDGDVSILRQIQKNIETNLAVLGFPEEGREFTPHLTLGRVRYAVQPQEQSMFAALLASTKFESTGDIVVNSVNIMESKLRPTGAVYNKIGSVQLME